MKLNTKAFSLIELLIAITIIGVISGIATLNFSQWIRKTNIEKEAKEFFADLNVARLQSVYTKKRHSIVVSPYSYEFRQYSSENENKFNGRAIFTKNVNYEIKKESGTQTSGQVVEFDIRGFTVVPSNNTFRIDPVNSGAAFDCIVISDARTNQGRMEQVGGSYECVKK